MAEALDPDAAERVLRRAGDIADADEREGTDDGIEPAALISAAVEVGIPERAVRQSLAIERLGPPPVGGRLDAMAGVATVAEQRVVRAPPDVVLDRLDRWLTGSHHLRTERRRPGEIEWARRDDVVGGVRRRVSGLSGRGRLGHAHRVRATVSPIDADTTIVRVSVDRHAQRRSVLAAGSTLGVGAVVVGAVGAAVTAPFAFAAIPAGVAGGLVFSSGRHQADTIRCELARLLDSIGEGRPPEGVLGGIRRRLTPRRSS